MKASEGWRRRRGVGRVMKTAKNRKATASEVGMGPTKTESKHVSESRGCGVVGAQTHSCCGLWVVRERKRVSVSWAVACFTVCTSRPPPTSLSLLLF